VLRDKVVALADDPDSRVRFRLAFALGETSDPRAEAALARIVTRDAGNRWIRAAVLSSCTSTADRLMVDLWRDTNPQVRGTVPADRAELLTQLAEVVGARNRSDEVGRVLDEMAADVGVAHRNLRDRLVLALARGARRSGGPLAIGPDPARPGAGLVAHLGQRARTTALDDRASES